MCRGVGMSAYLRNGFVASVSLLMVGLYLAVICGFSPYLANAGMISLETRAWILDTFPFASLVSGVAAVLILILSGIADVMFSRNSNAWKARWVLLMVVLQLIGLVIYYMIGSREKIENGHAQGRKRR